MYSCALVCAWPSVTSVFPRASWALSQQNPRVFLFYLVGCLQCQNGNPSCRFSAQGAIRHNKLANFYWKNGVWVSIKYGVIPIIFVSMASIHNARLFDIYDVRSPFLGEVHAIPPSCFVPSSVYRWWDHCAMRPVSHAIIHLAGVALVLLTMSAVELKRVPNMSASHWDRNCIHQFTIYLTLPSIGIPIIMIRSSHDFIMV